MTPPVPRVASRSSMFTALFTNVYRISTIAGRTWVRVDGANPGDEFLEPREVRGAGVWRRSPWRRKTLAEARTRKRKVDEEDDLRDDGGSLDHARRGLGGPGPGHHHDDG